MLERKSAQCFHFFHLICHLYALIHTNQIELSCWCKEAVTLWELSNEAFSVCCTICCKHGLECKCSLAGAWFELRLWHSWFYWWFDMLLNACFWHSLHNQVCKNLLDYTWLENISKMSAKWTAWTRGRRKSTERMSRTTQSWTRDKCWTISFFLSLRLDRWTLMARLCGKL